MASKQNVAKGNDRVAVQAGKVLGRAERAAAETAETDPQEVANVRSGNARVGKQVDEVRGGLTIRSKRRR